MTTHQDNARILDPGFNLTLRPMKYPQFYEMYIDGIKNTWSVDEVSFSKDIQQLSSNVMNDQQRHMIHRLVAFFATGDTIVSNNLVLNLYKHINSPEARMYLSRQLFEEAQHIQFYLTLLDAYIPDPAARAEAFNAIESIPSIRHKADFCFKWIDNINELDTLDTQDKRRQFLLNLICFATCIEGLFFFGAFAYVYYLRSLGLLPGLADGTNWVFRDESCMPAGSEILTEYGFMKFEDLMAEKNSNRQIRVAEYREDGSMQFVFPRGYVDKFYEGKLVSISSNKSISLTTTIDHDNVTRSITTGKIRKTKADKTSTSSTSQMICAGLVDGPDITLSAMEKFAVAFQADGHLPKRYTGERCGTVPAKFTLRKERKIKRFEAILKEANLDYSVIERGARTYKVNVPLAHIQYLSKDFAWLNLDRIGHAWGREFIEEISHWDSYIGPDRTCTQYVNTNRQAVDTVQAVASMSGFSTTQHKREDNRKAQYKDVYNLYIKQRDYAMLHKADKEEIDYAGQVYCVNVPSGMIVVRQEGKVHITGNCHINFALEVINVVRQQEPDLFDAKLNEQIRKMIDEAVDCESQFAQDVLSGGLSGINESSMREYLQYVADGRLVQLGLEKCYGSKNPFSFMELQDIQEVTNFFERRPSAYQVGISGQVGFDDDF